MGLLSHTDYGSYEWGCSHTLTMTPTSGAALTHCLWGCSHCSSRALQNFSQSTDVIKPLTAEEKVAKVEELRKRIAEKRAIRAQAEKDEEINQVKIRRASAKVSMSACVTVPVCVYEAVTVRLRSCYCSRL